MHKTSEKHISSMMIVIIAHKQALLSQHSYDHTCQIYISFNKCSKNIINV